MEVLKGSIGNRLDSPTTIEITDDLAREFMATDFYDPEGPLYQAVLNWMASREGRNVAWHPADEGNMAALDDLYHRIRAIEKATAAA